MGIVLWNKRIVKRTGANVSGRRGELFPHVETTALATDHTQGREVLEAARRIKEAFPEAHLICGLSNVSYGLPNRKVLNRVFLTQTLTMGMDAFILNPLDNKLMGDLLAAQALLGQDPYCANYLTAHRKGLYQE